MHLLVPMLLLHRNSPISWVTSVAMFTLGAASTAAALAFTFLAPALEPAAPCRQDRTFHSQVRLITEVFPDQERAAPTDATAPIHCAGPALDRLEQTLRTIVAGRRCTRLARDGEARALCIARNETDSKLLAVGS